jgi:hypothetical protein
MDRAAAALSAVHGLGTKTVPGRSAAPNQVTRSAYPAYRPHGPLLRAELALGLEFQGPVFTYGSCLENILALALLWIAFIRAKRAPSFRRNLLAHWMLFVWLGWYAFPYLGELP